jgi:branched-chain amino acid transport system ATP-binding protein
MWRRGEENEAEYIEADQIISSLGLSFCRNELVVSLPYGIQRKVQLALAMATRPEILLLDEPVSGMNRTEATSMADLIRKIREAGITVVIVEHNMDFVMNLCERIIVVDYGAKIAEGLPHEIANNPEVIKAYLGDIDAT